MWLEIRDVDYDSREIEKSKKLSNWTENVVKKTKRNSKRVVDYIGKWTDGSVWPIKEIVEL